MGLWETSGPRPSGRSLKTSTGRSSPSCPEERRNVICPGWSPFWTTYGQGRLARELREAEEARSRGRRGDPAPSRCGSTSTDGDLSVFRGSMRSVGYAAEIQIRKDTITVNVFLLGAALLLFYIGVMHTVLAEWRGERRVVKRIWELSLCEGDSEKDLLARRIVRLAWHLTSVTWCGVAGVITYLSCTEPTGASVVVLRILVVTFLLHSLLSIVLVRGQHPSWYGFLIVAALLFAGSFTA